MYLEIVGTVGACLLLLAYMLVSSGRIGLNDRSGQLLNLGGSVMLGVNAVSHGAIPPAMLNLIWALIAIAAMVRRPKNAAAPPPPEDGTAS